MSEETQEEGGAETGGETTKTEVETPGGTEVKEDTPAPAGGGDAPEGGDEGGGSSSGDE